MKVKKYFIIAVCVLVGLVSFVPLLRLLIVIDFNATVKEGAKIVEEIERQKEESGFYPKGDCKTIIGKKGTEFYYWKVSEDEFVVWTQGYSVGESIEYNSKTKEWQKRG